MSETIVKTEKMIVMIQKYPIALSIGTASETSTVINSSEI